MELLKDLGINTQSETVESLKDKCFEVFENPSMIFCPLTDQLIKDGFYTISNENGNIHGKVSNKNSVLQMSELIDIANQVDAELGLNLNFGKAKLAYFKDESIAELSIPLGISQFTTRNGFKDATKLFLFIKTGFGGVSCSEVGIYSHRFVCTNGMEVRKGLNYFKCKHTEKMNIKVKTFLAEVLPKFLTSVDDFTKYAVKLDSIDITDEQINEFKRKFFNYDKNDDLSTKKTNMIHSFNKSMEIEMGRVGQTAWGLLQSATNYTNHGHYNSSPEFTKVGTGATLNAKAETFCLAL